MGFYAPYRLEQNSLWLIAYRSVLITCKDIVRLIARKYLVHWFKDKADYYFSVDFGRLYREEERAIQYSDTFVQVEKDQQELVCQLSVANLKANKNVLLLCEMPLRYKMHIQQHFGSNLLEQDRDEILKYTNTGQLTLMLIDDSYRTTRGTNADLIIVTNFDSLNRNMFYKVVVPILTMKNVKLVCFYYKPNEIIEKLREVNGFKFVKL